MPGHRARIGILVPPGNPTTEPEVIRLAPRGVSVHFTRMVAHGETGSLEGQEERNRTQIAHLDENVALLAMVKPSVIVLAHTATSYTLGRDGEQALVERLTREHGIPLITAFGSADNAVAALKAGPAGCIVTFAMTQLAISATQIRKLFANRLSARYLLPDEVLDYIQTHSLYRNA